MRATARPRACRRGRRVAAVVAGLALTLAACSSGASSSDGAASSKATTTAAGSSTTTEAKPKTLHILVTNDDGYSAPGIDALVEGLATLDHVDISVVAPLEQQSGTGGKETEGKVAVTDVETLSGHAAKAVDGFPADSVRVAIDELHLQPDVVISGINSVQNLGPAIDASGTVGAARAAVARGVPALATSQGGAKAPDYPAAVPFILDWVREHRTDLVAASAKVEVTNLNVPTCTAGEVRGLLEVPADLDGSIGQALAAQDCTSTVPEGDVDGDVEAFVNGFATIDVIPAKPGS